MPSIVQIAAFAGLAGLAVATPIEKVQKRNAAFRINQVVKQSANPKVGSLALQKAYKKYNLDVPTHVAAAAAAAVSGTVAANPEDNDSEYLCPVDVGGTTLTLDFDTGSADL